MLAIALLSVSNIQRTTTSFPHIILILGQSAWILALFSALSQFLLMSRIGRLERIFWFDRLVSIHKAQWYIAFGLILLHPILITVYYSNILSFSLWTSFGMLIQGVQENQFWLIAVVLFVLSIIVTIRHVRKKLYYESRYTTHLLVYLAMVLAGIHHSFKVDGVEQMIWIGLYAFVIVNIIWYRLLKPLHDYYYQQWTISNIVQSSASSVSLTITWKHLDKRSSQAGQFVKIRILENKLWWESHPFSLSQTSDGKTLRLTVKQAGNYTKKLLQLDSGSKVIVYWPFGRFTNTRAKTNKRLYIAWGIGITPIYPLAQESLQDHQDTILLYSNKDPHDVPLDADILALQDDGLQFTPYFSQQQVHGAKFGRITFEDIQKNISDYLSRDIYICGPKSMILGLARQFRSAGLPKSQLHYEVFEI